MRSATRGVSLCGIGLFFTLVTLHGASGQAQAQGQAGNPRITGPRRPYTLNVTTGHRFIDVALKADAARLSDIAVDLSKRLDARVMVGPSLQQETISVDVPESALEAALARLAPRVFVDYEVRQGTGATVRDIYLLGPTDTAPDLNTEIRGQSQGLLVTGHTEEMPAAPGEDPLKIAGDRQGLMITVKQQPLSLVAITIADVLGVPLELKYEASEPVDLDIRYYAPPEEVISRLSPNVRLFMRVDVIGQRRAPLRLVVERSVPK
jgi:hypothetical protein